MREDPGTPVGALVSPTKQVGCGYLKKCLVGESDCGRSGITYKATCTEYPKDGPNPPPLMYLGTSGSNIHHRSLLHKRDVKKPTSALYRHNSKFHQNDPHNCDRFKFEVIATHKKVIPRFLDEAFRISHRPKQVVQ